MKLPIRTVVLTVLSLVVALAAVTHGSLGSNAQTQLPPGKWTFAAGPYSGPGYESIPVDVFSVTTRVDRGLTTNSVGLKNRTTKDVVSVRLHWYLTDIGQGRLVREGETPLVGVDLPAGKQQALNYPVASFAKILKPLLKGGSLSGNYRLEIAVSEVQYADEVSWLMGEPNAFRVKAAYRQPLFEGCQSQGCVYNAEAGSYICAAHDGTYCSVGNNGNSCTESRCPGLLD
jgi:hypothetical protein